MPSSEMLRRVALVRTDASEERSVSVIRVTRTGGLRTTLAVARYCRRFCDILHDEDGGDTFIRNASVIRATPRYFPEVGILQL
jgi:hypothetical protein